MVRVESAFAVDPVVLVRSDRCICLSFCLYLTK